MLTDGSLPFSGCSWLLSEEAVVGVDDVVKRGCVLTGSDDESPRVLVIGCSWILASSSSVSSLSVAVAAGVVAVVVVVECGFLCKC